MTAPTMSAVDGTLIGVEVKPGGFVVLTWTIGGDATARTWLSASDARKLAELLTGAEKEATALADERRALERAARAASLGELARDQMVRTCRGAFRMVKGGGGDET